MRRVDTAEDFRIMRDGMEPVYIQSRTRGRVPVPCCTTLLVRTEMVVANAYNPNSVPDDRMRLLEESILQNGFCFPIVAIWDDELEAFVVIDGFHRRVMGSPGWLDFDYVPIVVLQHGISERMTATVQFNKARGVHQVDLDAELVRRLAEQGMPDEDIADKLGMELDSVHRYKQITGIAELFKGAEYSQSWEMVDDDEHKDPTD